MNPAKAGILNVEVNVVVETQTFLCGIFYNPGLKAGVSIIQC